MSFQAVFPIFLLLLVGSALHCARRHEIFKQRISFPGRPRSLPLEVSANATLGGAWPSSGGLTS